MSIKKLSIVVPVFNEAKTVRDLLARVISAPLPTGIDKEVIVVDDGSTDGTRDVLNKLGSRYKIILREENGGKGAALKDGFQIVAGDYIIIQDADLEYDPKEYPNLLKPVIDGEAEVVFGSRTKQYNNVPFSQVYFYGGLILTKVFNFFFRTRLTDLATCYKLFPSHFVTELEFLPANDFVFDVVELSHFLIRHSRLVEVPITYRARPLRQGKKLNWRHGWRCLMAMIRLRLSIEGLVRKLRYRKVLNLVRKGSRVLDIGCGPHLTFLKSIQSEIKEGWAVDKKIIPRRINNLEIFNVNLDDNPQLPFPDKSVKQVFLLAVLEHILYPEKVMAEIKRVLSSDGELILTTPTTWSKPVLEFLAFRLKIIQPEEILDHKHYFSKPELLAVSKRVGFKQVQHEYFELGFNHLLICRNEK